MRSFRRGALVVAPLSRGLCEKKMEAFYYQESYEALQRLRASPTYPGTIKAATPGDTRFYRSPSRETSLPSNERHFWRTVVDDPAVEPLLTVRVRFREECFVAPAWESRLHFIACLVSPSSTVRAVHDAVLAENNHPWVAANAFVLASQGRTLDPGATLAECGLLGAGPDGVDAPGGSITLDAIDPATDHRWHLADSRLKDWNTAELSATDLKTSPYKELTEAIDATYNPRMLTKPLNDRYGNPWKSIV